MKYALCLRGINYFKDYMHDGRAGMTPYTIDFSDTIPYLFENIIKPLEEKGHSVDIFFVTYDTPKLNEYINIMKPKDVLLKTFNPNITSGNWKNIIQLMVESIKVVNEYEIKNNFNYDFTIISRFDYIIIENILKVYLEPKGISTVRGGDDIVFIIGKQLNTKIKELLEYMHNYTSLISHQYTKFLHENGILVHAMYEPIHDEKHCPFYRATRLIFNKKGHYYYWCDIEDVYNPESNYYGFYYKPNKYFVSGH